MIVKGPFQDFGGSNHLTGTLLPSRVLPPEILQRLLQETPRMRKAPSSMLPCWGLRIPGSPVKYSNTAWKQHSATCCKAKVQSHRARTRLWLPCCRSCCGWKHALRVNSCFSGDSRISVALKGQPEGDNILSQPATVIFESSAAQLHWKRLQVLKINDSGFAKYHELIDDFLSCQQGSGFANVLRSPLPVCGNPCTRRPLM